MKRLLLTIFIVLALAAPVAADWEPGGAGTGDIESVAAGNGLTGGGTTGALTMTVGPGLMIDAAADTVDFDYTEAEDATWGDGSVTGASLVWTFNIGAGTDPVITISDGVINVSAGALQVGGVAVGSGGGVTKGYEHINAGGMVPDTTSGLLQVDSNPNILDYLAFDGGTDEFALFVWRPPDDWDASTLKAKFTWAASAAMTDTQTVIFGLNCYAVTDGDTVDVAFDTGAQTASDAYATSDETGPIQKVSAATGALTVQGTPAVGDTVYCRVHRDADTDTATIDAWLLGVTIEYGRTGTTPTAW